MKALIQKFFQPTFEHFNQVEPGMALELATAVLLIEVSRADFDQDPTELEHIKRLLLDHLSLCEEEIDVLLEHAHQEADHLVSIQHVTRIMNQHMDQEGKRQVIEMMWSVVYADGDKHHYEEHLMRQVAELLYVSHEDFIRARHLAEENIGKL